MKRQIEHFKRTLAGLLATAMVLTMAPEAVFAADDIVVSDEVVVEEDASEEVIVDDAALEEEAPEMANFVKDLTNNVSLSNNEFEKGSDSVEFEIKAKEGYEVLKDSVVISTNGIQWGGEKPEGSEIFVRKITEITDDFTNYKIDKVKAGDLVEDIYVTAKGTKTYAVSIAPGVTLTGDGFDTVGEDEDVKYTTSDNFIGKDLTFTVTPAEGKKINDVNVKVGKTKVEVKKNIDKEYVLERSAITGNVSISYSVVNADATIVPSLDGAIIASNTYGKSIGREVTVESGKPYSFYVKLDDGVTGGTLQILSSGGLIKDGEYQVKESDSLKTKYTIPAGFVEGTVTISFEKNIEGKTIPVSLAKKDDSKYLVKVLSANGEIVDIAADTKVKYKNYEEFNIYVANKDNSGNTEAVVSVKANGYDLALEKSDLGDVFDDGYDYALYGLKNEADKIYLDGPVVISVSIKLVDRTVSFTAPNAVVATDAKFANPVSEIKALSGNTVSFYVKAKPGYKLGTVMDGDTELTPVNGKYSVAVSNADKTITVNATEDKYAVSVLSGNALVYGEEEATGNTAYEFKVDGTDDVIVDTVTYQVSNGPVKTAKFDEGKGKYIIPAAEVVGNIKITVNTKRYLKIEKDLSKLIKIDSVVCNGATLECTETRTEYNPVAEQDITCDLYPYTPNTGNITIKASINEESEYAKIVGSDILAYSISPYATDWNNIEKEIRVKNGVLSVPSSENGEMIQIKSSPISQTALYVDGEITTVANNSITKDAVVGAYSYVGQDPTIVSVNSIKIGTKNLSANAVEKIVSYDEKVARFDFREQAGKTLVVTVDGYIEEEGKLVKTSSKAYTFVVAAELTSIAVKEAKNGVINQAAGTTKTYHVEVNKGADTSAIKNPNGTYGDITVSAWKAETLTFNVTTKVKEDAENLPITIKTGDDEEDIKAEVVIKSNFDAIKAAQPVVKYVSATDTTITVSSELPAALKNAGYDLSKMSFVFTAVAVVSGNEIMKDEAEPVIVPASDDSYNATLVVVRDPEDPEEVPGPGIAYKYNVKVQLVQADGATLSVPSKVSKNLVASTFDPLYETKLVAKKTSNKIYTGTTTEIATINWSKNTLPEFRDLTAVIKDAQGEEVLTGVSAIYDSGIVKLTVADNLNKVGNYTVELAAKAAVNGAPATAKLAVNVLPRTIKDETVYQKNENVKLYRKNGKSATIALGSLLEYDLEYSKQLLKKYKWEITTDNITTAEAKVDKNGKLTVTKNLLLGSNGEKEITVVATSLCKSMGIVPEEDQLTFTVTVTSKPDKISSLTIMGDAGEIGDTVKLSDIDEDGIGVCATNADGDQVAVSYKMSPSKGILTYEFEGVLVAAITKPGKYTITATALDGSKSKMKRTINVIYDDDFVMDLYGYFNPADVDDNSCITNDGISASNMETGEKYKPNAVVVNNYGTLDKSLQLILKNSSNVTNAAVKVKGGKASDIKGTGVYKIAPNAAQTIITITDKVTKKTYKYTINNVMFTKNKAKKISSQTGVLYTSAANTTNLGYKISGFAATTETYGKCEAHIALNAAEEAKWINKEKEMDTNYAKLFNLLDKTPSVGMRGEFTLKVDADTYGIKAGSYKYNVVLYVNGQPIDAQPSTITVKVTKNPKTSVKIASKYAFTSRSTSFDLDIKGKATVSKAGKVATAEFVAITNTEPDPNGYRMVLQNANIKGTFNEITKYFEVNDAGDKIVLKAGVQLKDVPSKDLTGYVTYNYRDSITGIVSPSPVTAKITVTYKN